MSRRNYHFCKLTKYNFVENLDSMNKWLKSTEFNAFEDLQ